MIIQGKYLIHTSPFIKQYKTDSNIPFKIKTLSLIQNVIVRNTTEINFKKSFILIVKPAHAVTFLPLSPVL